METQAGTSKLKRQVQEKRGTPPGIRSRWALILVTHGVTTAYFQGMPHARMALEAGTHSIGISQPLQAYGHEVLVAHVTERPAIVRNISKSDQVDAEQLARYARPDPRILRPIPHRIVEAQQALSLVRARDVLVRLRVVAVHAVRG